MVSLLRNVQHPTASTWCPYDQCG